MGGETSYITVLTGQYEAVRVAMMRIMAAELTAIIPVLKWTLSLYFIIQFALFAMGRLGGWAFIGTIVRAGLIVFVLGGQGIWINYVANNSFEKVPTNLAGIASGGPSVLTAPQQFQNVSMAIDNAIADIRRKNTAFSVSAIGNAGATWAAWAGLQFGLAVQAYVWVGSIRLMAISLCIGPWLLLFEFFSRTRGFFQYWMGLIVGIWCFQLAASVWLQISMQSEFEMLRLIQESNASNSVDIMIANIGHVGTSIFGDALTMLLLPTICAVGGGAGAHMGATRAAAAIPGAAARLHDKMRAGT